VRGAPWLVGAHTNITPIEPIGHAAFVSSSLLAGRFAASLGSVRHAMKSRRVVTRPPTKALAPAVRADAWSLRQARWIRRSKVVVVWRIAVSPARGA